MKPPAVIVASGGFASRCYFGKIIISKGFTFTRFVTNLSFRSPDPMIKVTVTSVKIEYQSNITKGG